MTQAREPRHFTLALQAWAATAQRVTMRNPDVKALDIGGVKMLVDSSTHARATLVPFGELQLRVRILKFNKNTSRKPIYVSPKNDVAISGFFDAVKTLGLKQIDQELMASIMIVAGKNPMKFVADSVFPKMAKDSSISRAGG